ncbi:MAG: beta-ketoacyl-ACP synthase II [Candidatus Sericytochromatia bacterium]|nr:beta-ketoacyl-ACP synthase II [Candidatus Tanganyikabacteria bacterium]
MNKPEHKHHRVVVTGMGCITPLGSTLEKYWSSLLAGTAGAGPIGQFDVSALPVRFACEVKDFDPAQYMSPKEAKRNTRFIQFAIAASKQAWQHAGFKEGDGTDANRVGVYVGSGMGALAFIEEQHGRLESGGADRVSPFLIPSVIVNMAAGLVSMAIGAKGPNLCTVSACATGGHAIGEAFRALERGDADVILAGGTEAAITPLSIAGFHSAKALSSRNDDPTKASRPFDADRDGFVMGEGAGVLVLETLDHATRRGAQILGEIVGYGLSGDAFHMTAPAPEAEGAQRAMRMALADAGMEPTDIDYINAHGTSTDLNDKLETQAVKKVFGDHARKLAISSTKSMTGHLLGAAGGIEAIATVMALREGVMPPTINYSNADPECDLDYVPNTARKADLRVAMSNNMGFGGQNCSLIFKTHQG